MLNMTIGSKDKLLKERDRIQSVLMEVLGRAPKGCLMDQLTAKLWNQPNFETAIALADKQDKQAYSFENAAKDALSTLGIKDNQGSLEALINTSILNMGEDVFNVPKDELKHKVMLIAIYHYIHEKYKDVALDGDTKYLEKYWLDYDLYKAATRKSGYDFYNAIDTATTSMARIATNWMEQGYVRADCSVIAMVHYDAFRLLKNALGEHSCFDIGSGCFASVYLAIEQQLMMGGKLGNLKASIADKDTNGALELLKDHAQTLIASVNSHLSDQFSYEVAGDVLTIIRRIAESDRKLNVSIVVKATKRCSFKISHYCTHTHSDRSGGASKKIHKVSMIDDVSNAYYPMQNARNIASNLQATINASTM